MFPYYIFVAALISFLLYNYRQVIKEKLGYEDSQGNIAQSAENLQSALRGTADALIEQFTQEHRRMEEALAKAEERIAQLETLLQKTEIILLQPAEKPIASIARESSHIHIRSDDHRIRIVSQMAEQGMDVHEISQATGLGYGEVRLLLNIGRAQQVNSER